MVIKVCLARHSRPRRPLFSNRAVGIRSNAMKGVASQQTAVQISAAPYVSLDNAFRFACLIAGTLISTGCNALTFSEAPYG